MKRKQENTKGLFYTFSLKGKKEISDFIIVIAKVVASLESIHLRDNILLFSIAILYSKKYQGMATY